jgi:hypothetical protein
MAEPLRIRNVDIKQDRTEVYARGYRGRIEFYGDKGSYEGYEGLSWKTLKFKDIDASVKDGALIELDAGRRTPVELVLAEKSFSEVPLEGDLVFVHIDRDGNISSYHFDSERKGDYSFSFEVGKGEFFCWVALDKPSQIMEYEEPGFTDLDLKLVDSGTKEISEKKIPDQFWTMIEQLEKGETKNTAVPIMELDNL